MKLIALTGLHGAGKDTVADALPARKLAFADTLYEEVAEAFGVSQIELRCRDGKEVAHEGLCMDACASEEFREWHFHRFGVVKPVWQEWAFTCHSPRQILQWWGDYQRAYDPDYFVDAVRVQIEAARGIDKRFVITDVRQANEAAMVRQLGGQIWQIVRPGHEPPRTGHHTETDGSEFAPDLVLVNSWGIAELQAAALEEWMK